MTIDDLISIDKHKVRRDSNLMHLYIDFFKETFNYSPNCAGCSFDSDWNKLKNFYFKKKPFTQKLKIMSNKITIKKVQGKILTYHKNGKTYRLYDNILTDDFIKEYVSNGTPEEIAERKKLFNFPSKKETPIVEEKKEIIFESKTIKPRGRKKQ